MKKDKNRRKGKGRRFCLGGKNLLNSLPRYIATLFDLRRFWRIGWIHSFLFSKHPGAIHPIFQVVQCKTASDARNWIHAVPQTEATTFAFSSVRHFFLKPWPSGSCLPAAWRQVIITTISILLITWNKGILINYWINSTVLRQMLNYLLRLKHL